MTPYGQKDEVGLWIAMTITTAGAAAVFVAVEGEAVFAYAGIALMFAFYSVVCEQLNRHRAQPAARRMREGERRRIYASAAVMFVCGVALLAQGPFGADPWRAVALVPFAISLFAVIVVAIIDVRTFGPRALEVKPPARPSEAVWQEAKRRLRWLVLLNFAAAVAWVAAAQIASERTGPCELGNAAGCDTLGYMLLVLFYALPVLLVLLIVLLAREISRTASRARRERSSAR